MIPEKRLGRSRLLMLAAITACSVANGYYIHSIVAQVGQDLGVDAATAGIAPAANQIALAIGVLLLLPLGDILDNRKLCLVFSGLQCLFLVAMAAAPDFAIFSLASGMVGLVTIVPYLLPAYAAKRVGGEQLGQATAYLAVGVIIGIFFARISAGLVVAYWNWRVIYHAAAVAMLASCALIWLVMDADAPVSPRPRYRALLASTVRLFLSSRPSLLAGVRQVLNFGILISMWIALALHVTGAALRYGADTVSYLTIITLVSALVTPGIARWAGRFGRDKALTALVAAQIAAILALLPVEDSLIWLAPPMFLLSATAGPVDVINRMVVLSSEPTERTRLMTGYIFVMFLGGGAASWTTTRLYADAGWIGVLLLNAVLAGIALLLALVPRAKPTSGA
ncbi:MFS transporter [uncultured Martelella sp.]|uniref:MFS transporter n=1 Tax=uncultured Martelella sp. TaxID=392331 RepID=UPI0029C7B33D|nr:MFS transporter [uncultured Martelella sp.]